MKRLITRLSEGRADIKDEVKFNKAVARLAEYEDTGLTPDQVKDMAENAESRLLTWFESRYGFSVGELMGLLEAKQDNRLVVLPCKVGDTLYDVGEFINGAPYPEIYVCHADYIGIGMSKDGKTIFDIDCCDFLSEDFGKTVFRTRAEAEAALDRETEV